MPLSYPLTRAQFFDLLRIESAAAPSLSDPVAELRRADGGLQRAALGEALWQGSVGLVPAYHPDAAGNEALLSLLLRPGATFFAGDPRYTGPAEDPGGAVLAAPIRNGNPNSLIKGATVGVLGSGGVLPTNWSVVGMGATGVEVVSIAPENGRPTLILRLNGTPTGATVFVNTCGSTCTPATAGQVWTGSLWAQVVAGSLDSRVISKRIVSLDGGGLGVGSSSVDFTASSADLLRRTITWTATGATAVAIRSQVTITHVSGALDVTLKLQAPQIELGSAATDFQSTPVAPKLHSVTEARRELRLFDLPAGYVLSRGDLLSFAYGSDPTRYALHRIVVGGVTAGDGITPQLEVVPSVRAGFALNAAVNLLTPSCKAIMRQAGMGGTSGQIITAGSGFEWVQVLR
jgi:hypothetical protein